MIEELVGRVFVTRNMAHVEHFRTGSFAAHKALDGFYSDVIGAVDDLVEAFQGLNGKIDPVKFPAASSGSIVDHLEREAEWIAERRSEIADGSEALGNLVDELTGVYLKALYLLKNLK